MDISCPANRVLIFGSYFSVSCRQASRPSLSPARNTVLRAAPLQIMSIIQWSCADAARSSSSTIVAFGVGSVPFAASSISFSRRLCSSLATRLAPLTSRLASPANACPFRLPSSAFNSGGPRTSWSEYRQLVQPACCLLCANSWRQFDRYCLANPQEQP